eukprot:CAMPEP_0185740122 /NCGR_PEP_ID=MMETSP1171-20130828/37056_1 /TAXON_ID=374046 /ORGANISM="Helicotheca tamensis, Strain CCMP826" /LENGTH=70 /DNA_ID=CAMNT_0028411885 /DNA_START=96 /DNA_END=305 /DNA_ORIENTATION=+
MSNEVETEPLAAPETAPEQEELSSISRGKAAGASAKRLLFSAKKSASKFLSRKKLGEGEIPIKSVETVNK